MKNPLIIVIAFLFIAAGLAASYDTLIDRATAEEQAAEVKQQQATGEALIGGPFELINQRGKTVKDDDFRGRLMLVFFGFTTCPDVCPTGLLGMTQLLKQMDESQRAQIAPIFITVDHETDTVEQMATYLSNFDPAIQGLTGTPEQLKAAQEAYRVYAKKIEMEGSMMKGPMFNHSSFVYLMDRDGNYLTHFQYNTKPEEMLEEIRQHL